jgi:hypothetical protein
MIADTKTALDTKAKPPALLAGEASLVYENGIVAITVQEDKLLRTTVFYNVSNFAAPFMFAVDAHDNLGGDEDPQRISRALMIQAFIHSINKDYACGWFAFDSTAERYKPTLVSCGLIDDTDAVTEAMLYTADATVYHLETVPRVFTIGRETNMRDLATLYSGRTTIHGEYTRYCDPNAYVDMPSVADRAIHKSLQLHCLVRSINSVLSNNSSTFARAMAAKAQRLFSDEDGLLHIMQLMRRMQVDTEFDRYFKIPNRSVQTPRVYLSIVSGDTDASHAAWTGAHLLAKSLVPAPRII